MKIHIIDDAFNDLYEIYQYIADNDAVEHADHMLESIHKRIYALSELPLRGALVKELVALGNKNYREVYFKPYRIIYTIKEDTIFIVVIGDGRHDFGALLERRLLIGRII